MFPTLRHFRPSLRNYHALIKTDNTTVVAYINRQGGTLSLRLHRPSIRIILLRKAHLLSLHCATHVPGILNVGVDLLSTGNLQQGEWRFHPQVVKQIWERYGQESIDLFTLQRKRALPVVIRASKRHTSGGGCTGTPLPEGIALRFSSPLPHTPHCSQSEGRMLIPHLGSPTMIQQALGGILMLDATGLSLCHVDFPEC